MFFRRERTKKLTFDDYLSQAKSAGFQTLTAGNGRHRLERTFTETGDNKDSESVTIACLVEAGSEDVPRVVVKPGVVIGDEIGALTDQGFQKIFLTPHGKRKPAQAEELKAIHNFQEDLREAFGLTSLYNEAMGTVSNLYLYDRVEGRDFGHANKAWQAPIQKR